MIFIITLFITYLLFLYIFFNYRWIIHKVCLLLFSLVLFLPIVVNAEDYAINAKSAILVEADTGTILFEKNKDERLSVASLTKMMAQIIILEEVEKGNLKWDEMVTTSANAAGYGGTQIYLEAGEKMSVNDLMKAISMASANDATVVLAERIAGSEEKFVEMMNNKAKELGLQNTNFVNPTGLDEDNHYSSSYDLSIIARELLKHEEILEFTSIYEDYLRQDTPNKFWLVNTNKLVKTYDGVDGLKTGFTNNALYTMAVTAKKDNMRLIAIVLGEEVSKVRNKEVAELLDYGFVSYKVDLIKKKGELVNTIKISKGNKNKLRVVLDSDIKILTNKSDNGLKYDEKIVMDEIKLPIHVGDKLGVLELYNQGKIIGTYNLVSNDNVKQKNIFSIFLDNLKKIIVGNLIY